MTRSLIETGPRFLMLEEHPSGARLQVSCGFDAVSDKWHAHVYISQDGAKNFIRRVTADSKDDAFNAGFDAGTLAIERSLSKLPTTSAKRPDKEPIEPRMLYHYCSTDAFVSIVQSRSIRLSSLILSNDSHEGRLAEEILVELARRDQRSGEEIEKLRAGLDALRRFAVLGFCLSEDGDLLSQWRGYGDDGRGLAIGFSREYLEARCPEEPLGGPRLRKVDYVRPPMEGNEGKWDDIDLGTMEQVYLRIKQDVIELGKYESLPSILRESFHEKLFSLKGDAFKEEAEWRITQISQDKKLSQFRPSPHRVVPFTVFNELPYGAIRRVVLGPKHTTPRNFLHALLRPTFGQIEIDRSRATYG